MPELITVEDAIEMMADPVGDPIGGIERVVAAANRRAEEVAAKLAKVSVYADDREKEIRQLREDQAQEQLRIDHLLAHAQKDQDRERASAAGKLADLHERIEKLTLDHHRELELLRQERVELQERIVKDQDGEDKPGSLPLQERLDFLERKADEGVNRAWDAERLAKEAADRLQAAYSEWIANETDMKRRLALKSEIPRIISRLRGVPEAIVHLPKGRQELVESEWAGANP